MDPKATIFAIIKNHGESDGYTVMDETTELFEALEEWLLKGGSRPRIPNLGWNPICPEIGGNGFDGPRRAGTPQPEKRVDGPRGMHLRTWGGGSRARIVFVASNKKRFWL